MTLTPKEIFEEKIPAGLKANPDVAEKINATYQFELTGDDGGKWAIDLTKNGLAIPCVDELACVPLDLWAEEAGYEKLQRNLLLL